MLLADILFLTIVVYLAYRFIFNFLLPIVRATHQVRQQFRNAQGPMSDSFSGSTDPGGKPGGSEAAGARRGSRGDSSGTAGAGGGKQSHKPPAEDYIDFEEVK
jgi:hypothetical protein